jgi:hypothetical protein
MRIPVVHSIRPFMAAGAAILLTLSIAGATAAAQPTHRHISRGDVTAAFQARTTGGYLNGLMGHTTAAPVRGLQNGRISFFSDRTYCSTDWHYLGVTFLADNTFADPRAALNASAVGFSIDGQPVSHTTRTAIKPFVGTGIRGQLGISVGKLIPPGSLADGAHSLETVLSFPGQPDETLDVTFTLDPGACG